jgi:hypothetical protein
MGSCVGINADDAAELSRAPTTTSFKRPAKHRAFGEATTTGQFFARTPPKAFRADLIVETLSPLRTCAEGLALLPGPMPATWALTTPQMQPQHGGVLQDGQIADAPWSARFDAGAARRASGTHDGVVCAFEMHLKLFGAKHLSDDAKLW